MEKETVRAKTVMPSEAALAAALLITALAVVLLTKSDTGITSIMLFSFVLNTVLPELSLGTWNYITECAFILFAILITRQVKPGYIISIGMAVVIGLLIDMWGLLLTGLPVALPFRICYYAAGFWLLALGIFLLTCCGIPTTPYETFMREAMSRYKLTFRRIRTSFDVFFFLSSGLIGYLCTESFLGIGPGSVLMLFVGTAGSLWGRLIEGRFVFRPLISFLGRLSN